MKFISPDIAINHSWAQGFRHSIELFVSDVQPVNTTHLYVL